MPTLAKTVKLRRAATPASITIDKCSGQPYLQATDICLPSYDCCAFGTAL